MWEAIKELGQNKAVLLFLAGIIAVACYAIKKGILSFTGHGVSLGTADSEAKIRNMQQLYSKALFEGTVSDLPKECEYYHKRFVISQCLDEVERMIRENHITDDDTYIETEYQIIYAIVLKYTVIDYFREDDFKDYLHDLVEKLVKQLVKIRKQYS
jgi:hypothetical protein